MIFHPTEPLAFLLSELGSQLYVLRVAEDGRLTILDQVSTLPSAYTGQSLGGHLDFDPASQRLYVTNRGHNSMVVFELDRSGTIERRQIFPSLGASPRSFVRLGDIGRVLIAHEQSQNLCIMATDSEGKISAMGQAIHVPGLAFVAAI